MKATPSSPTGAFWRRIFDGEDGRICVTGLDRRPPAERLDPKKTMHEAYYQWPAEAAAAESHLWTLIDQGLDPYFCAHLLTKPRRSKETATRMRACYADRDGGDLPADAPHPTITVKTSDGHFHDYWILTRAVSPTVGEEINHRLAAATDADMSGWDLSQLLRPPGFPNRKHPDEPTVEIIADDGPVYDPEDLLVTLPPVPTKAKPAPAAAPPTTTAADVEIIERLRHMRAGQWGRLYDSGDLSGYGGNWSSADQGLANGLVAACEGDVSRADQLFRQSALWRDKWDERHYADGRTYGQGTLDTALAWYQTTPAKSRGETPAAAARDESTPDIARAEIDRLRDELEELRAVNRGILGILRSEAKPAAKIASIELALEAHASRGEDFTSAGGVADRIHQSDDTVSTTLSAYRAIVPAADLRRPPAPDDPPLRVSYELRTTNPWTGEITDLPHNYLRLVPAHARLSDTLAAMAAQVPDALKKQPRTPNQPAAAASIPDELIPSCPDDPDAETDQQPERVQVARCDDCGGVLAAMTDDGILLTPSTENIGRGETTAPEGSPSQRGSLSRSADITGPGDDPPLRCPLCRTPLRADGSCGWEALHVEIGAAS